MDDYNSNNELMKIIDNQENNKKSKSKIKLIFRTLFILVFLTVFVAFFAVFGIISDIVKKAPEIDPVNALYTLTESSVIVDEKGNIIEQIHDPNENREIIKLADIPKHVQDAFIAIEDHRFKEHFGIDIRRIGSSLLHNFQVGDPKSQGASTITQQLVKNLYLTNEKSWERKIMEIYLSLKVERILTKEQILENYLNTIPLGQSSYGVQTASYTYFSKDAKNLTLAESALIAGAAKSTVTYAPYNRYALDNIAGIPENDIVGYVDIGSVKYACVYNKNAIERQHVILDRMLELGCINQYEYEKAMSEDMKKALKPGQKKLEDISTSSMDYVKKKVIEDLMDEKEMDYNEAENYLFQGGLIITTTIDVDMQKSLEASYDNFSALYLGENPKKDVPVGQDWRYFKWEYGKGTGTLDSNLNILNEYGQHIYFDKINILDENNNLYLNKDEFSFNSDGNLIINSKKFDIYSSIDITDCYTIDENNNFVSHTLGALNIGSNYEILEKKGSKGTFLVTKDFTDKNTEMFKIDMNGTLKIPKEYFFFQEDGIVQPQSAAVIMDYRTGKIKAMFGGRNIEGSKLFNRATDAARQPGSTIKPLSVYLPALDLGYSAAYVLNDIPRKNELGERWPKNWYEYRAVKYWGKITLRKSIEQSINTNAVNMLEQLGTDASMEYLKKFNLINEENPEADTFVSPQENPTHNDVNFASLALGGLTKGFSPLYMTAAYSAIANDGIYVEPIVYTRVVNKAGETILDNIPETSVVASPEAASLMKDILRSTFYSGLSYRAKLPEEMGIEVAGKTGTTQSSGDFWYIGFSPYYIGGIWVGNDNVQLKLSGDSGANARFWSGIMTPIHMNLPPAKFEINKNLIPVNVCRQSGKLPGSLCNQDIRGSQVIREYFVPGTQPIDTCDIHVEAEICTNSNMLKSQYCPGNQIEKRVLIKRYAPSYADVQIQDTAFQVPETECTNHVKWHYDQWMNEQNNPIETNENYDDKEAVDLDNTVEDDD